MSNADIGFDRAALSSNASLPYVFDGGAGGARLGYLIVLAGDHLVCGAQRLAAVRQAVHHEQPLP